MTKEQIRAARLRLGLTQQELADKFGVNHNTISRWESGAIVPEAMGMLELAFTALQLQQAIGKKAKQELAELRKSGRILRRLANSQP
jgi:transcriptional regulator with XRE-family HTH domain